MTNAATSHVLPLSKDEFLRRSLQKRITNEAADSTDTMTPAEAETFAALSRLGF